MLGGARSRQSPVPDLDLLVAVSSRWLSETTEVPSGGQEIALLERTSGAAISARRFPNSTGRSRAVMTAARGLPFAASPPTHCGEHSGGITAAMSRSNPLRLHQRSAFQPTHLSVGLTIVARANAPDASASTVRHGLHMPDDARMVFHSRDRLHRQRLSFRRDHWRTVKSQPPILQESQKLSGISFNPRRTHYDGGVPLFAAICQGG